MKRFGKFFNAAVKASAFMVAAVIAFSACEKKEDPSVKVNQTEVSAEAAGGAFDVTVTSNVAWTADAQDKWVTVSPAEGTAGETKVTVTVKKNNTEDARETSVTFAGEGAIATVAVKQTGKDVVSLDKKTFAATPAGGSDAVKVTANTEWTASADADWVTVTPASGDAGEATATVTVAANSTTEARNAKVTFVAGEAKAEYTVSQEAVSVSVSNSNVAVAADGASAKVTVTANAAWTATVSADWVTVDPIEGAAGAVEVTVSADANETDADRTATVTFAANENVKAVVTVTQAFVRPTGKVAIKVGTVTSSTASITFTPDPATGFTYYCDVLPKGLFDTLYPTDEEKIDYIVNSINEQLAALPGYSWADVIDEGTKTYKFDSLSPVTEYYAVAFGIDASGNVTSGLYKGTFTTEDVNPALKDWMGTWKVTSEDTYVQPKDGDEGLTGEPSERIITISTDSVFELELGEADLIVAGISYTDGIPLFNGGLQLETIGTVNSKGQLELKNQVETFYAEGVGTFTWVGYCEIPAMETYSIVTGGYAPYTLAFGANKNVGTGTRYEGKISSGEPFYVTYYDMFIAREAGGWSSYYSTETGMLAGNWTLERVEDETAAAPQSLKLQTKVEKNLKAENVKYMKNFNAKALSKTVYSK